MSSIHAISKPEIWHKQTAHPYHIFNQNVRKTYTKRAQNCHRKTILSISRAPALPLSGSAGFGRRFQIARPQPCFARPGTMPGTGLTLCRSMAPGTAISIIHDLQSDFVVLIDCNGTQVVKYVYDALIKTLSTIVPTQMEDNMVSKMILYIQLESALAN